MFKNKGFKKIFSTLFTILTISYTGLFGCDTVIASKYENETRTATLNKPLHQIIITSKENCESSSYTQQLKDDFKFTDYWNFTYEDDMSEKNVIQHVVSVENFATDTLEALQECPETDEVIYSVDLGVDLDYAGLPRYLNATVLLRDISNHVTDTIKTRFEKLAVKLTKHYTLEGETIVCQRCCESVKQTKLYSRDKETLIAKPKLPTALPYSTTVKNARIKLLEKNVTNHSGNSESTDILRSVMNIKSRKRTLTKVAVGGTVVGLGSALILDITEKFTRKPQKSQTKNQVTQKSNQYVKNKI